MKNRINSFGGRSHSTPYTRAPEDLSYVNRSIQNLYVTITGSATGSGSGTTLAGTVSGVSYFDTASSISSEPDFTYDVNTKKMFVTSGSMSAAQLSREEYAPVDAYSTIRNVGDGQMIWDNYYALDGTFKNYWIQKEFKASGSNLQYVGILYSDVAEDGSKGSPITVGTYQYINYVAQASTNAGIRTTVGAKKYGFKQITMPIKIGSSTADMRVWAGITSTFLLMQADAPTTYDVIAFRSITSDTNWHLYHANASSATSMDTGVSVQPDTTYLLRLQIYGIQTFAWINDTYVGSLSAYSPSDTVDMDIICEIRNTNSASSQKYLGISHVHWVSS